MIRAFCLAIAATVFIGGAARAETPMPVLPSANDFCAAHPSPNIDGCLITHFTFHADTPVLWAKISEADKQECARSAAMAIDKASVLFMCVSKAHDR